MTIHKAVFTGPTSFSRARFDGRDEFRGAQFGSVAVHFGGAQFAEKVPPEIAKWVDRSARADPDEVLDVHG